MPWHVFRMDADFETLADQLFSLSSRHNLTSTEASALVGCASVLLHRVAPSPERVLAAVSVLRRIGGHAGLEEALLRFAARQGLTGG